MKAVILCGGMRTRLRAGTEYKPKPMEEIPSKPSIIATRANSLARFISSVLKGAKLCFR